MPLLFCWGTEGYVDGLLGVLCTPGTNPPDLVYFDARFACQEVSMAEFDKVTLVPAMCSTCCKTMCLSSDYDRDMVLPPILLL